MVIMAQNKEGTIMARYVKDYHDSTNRTIL